MQSFALPLRPKERFFVGVTFCVVPTFLFGGFRPAGRGERRVLSSDGKNQRSPGDGSDERLRGAGAHSHLSPGPPVTGAGPFGPLLPSGGLNFDCAPLYSRATGPSSSQSPLYSGRPSVGIRHVASLLLLSPPNPLRWALAGAPIMGSSNVHRLVPAYLFGAAVVGQMSPQLPSCHSFARLGGVRTARTLLNFHFVGACVPGARKIGLS